MAHAVCIFQCQLESEIAPLPLLRHPHCLTRLVPAVEPSLPGWTSGGTLRAVLLSPVFARYDIKQDGSHPEACPHGAQHMERWHYTENGTGIPLVLLHGVGMSHAAWKPVVPFLSKHRRVIAFDTAGFGQSLPLAPDSPPTIHNLAKALADNLIAIGITQPVDLVGNSMGGQLALEAAKLGVAHSVVAISPSGLWQRHPPRHAKALFFSQRYFAKRFPGFSRWLMGSPMAREIMLYTAISPGGRNIPTEDALRIRQDLVSAKAFNSTFLNTEVFADGQRLTIPITVAFGARDGILGKASQRHDTLPAHTRWLEPPRWGHVPMWRDPAGVAGLILNAQTWTPLERQRTDGQ